MHAHAGVALISYPLAKDDHHQSKAFTFITSNYNELSQNTIKSVAPLRCEVYSPLIALQDESIFNICDPPTVC